MRRTSRVGDPVGRGRVSGAQTVKMFGREVTKLDVLNFNTEHDNEMYGTMVAYLRIKGIVPRSSEGRP